MDAFPGIFRRMRLIEQRAADTLALHADDEQKHRGGEEKPRRFVFIFVFCTHQSLSIVPRKYNRCPRAVFVRDGHGTTTGFRVVGSNSISHIVDRFTEAASLLLPKCMRRRDFITDMKLRSLVMQNY